MAGQIVTVQTALTTLQQIEEWAAKLKKELLKLDPDAELPGTIESWLLQVPRPLSWGCQPPAITPDVRKAR